MCKAVLFDFDGVLTLDATGSTTIGNYITKITGIDRDLFTKEYRRYNKELVYGKVSHEEVWGSICDGINEEIDIQILKDSFINTPLDHDMLELVMNLKKLGYITGIITDNKKDRMDAVVRYYKLNDLFDYIIVSAEIGSGKDNYDIFVNVIDNLSLNPYECIFIDNKQKNLIIPNEMGMKSIFYDHEKREFKKLKEELKSIGVEFENEGSPSVSII